MNTNLNPLRLPLPAKALKVYIRKRGKLDFPVADLMFLQAISNYCWLHWQNGQRMLMPRTLKYYMDRLPDDCFIRLHRNCIVNLQYIRRIERTNTDKGGLVYLQSGAILPISRRRWLSSHQLLAAHCLPTDY
ncbi:LytTR family transcriptional regulator [Spirosoma sp. KCTC 42546]|uniref:LytR/AlgR family response regulator transcription factor n=1 Tax=Spirosoma sp. KCTC 42546 TaxID=2520506 RepID=UPI00115B0886|nr:LytTR family DNA-binding domain-containing protein [Spirosoma sp. KCTC 42546]QDK77249.1 LytTR family transcriptional regulator [Spirosoma sp. KCTC 42546]